VQFTKAFSGIFGFREDAINANTANPPLTEAGVNIADNSQELYTVPGNYLGYFSLPTPIYLDRGALYHYDASVTNPAYFVSLIYKLTETQSIYATYDRVDAITGQTNFGGVDEATRDSTGSSPISRPPARFTRSGTRAATSTTRSTAASLSTSS